MADRIAAPKMMAINPALCQKCDVCMDVLPQPQQTTPFEAKANRVDP
jgi:TPP-dependent indolepyruvate ferredoxin oxidoreductase alpha subunit